jgi:hypothetical protein
VGLGDNGCGQLGNATRAQSLFTAVQVHFPTATLIRAIGEADDMAGAVDVSLELRPRIPQRSSSTISVAALPSNLENRDDLAEDESHTKILLCGRAERPSGTGASRMTDF